MTATHSGSPTGDGAVTLPADLTDSGGATESPGRTIAYQPALDGVRALAVAVVLLFHAEVPGFSGGYLGVSVFFTLSGYLITSLLTVEIERDGQVALSSFYARRARRLVPASLLVVVAVAVAAATTDWFAGVDGLRAHAVGSLLQIANWVFLAGDGSYQELLDQASGAVSPLEHYWSLAIEEQFYWVWPVAFVALWRLGRSARGRLRLLGAITLAFVVAAPVIAVIWGADAAYWSTPARAAEILLGALAALVLRRVRVAPRWAVLAPLALAVLAVCVVTFPTAGGPAYAGALPAIGVVSVALIVGLQADSATTRAVSVEPLVWFGTISYGIYLFHWPVFVVVDESRLGVGGPLLLLARIGLTLTLAWASFALIERPIRHGLRVTPRTALVGAGAATGLTVALVLLLIPDARGSYWAAPSSDVDAVAIVVDDTPLAGAPLTTRPATAPPLDVGAPTAPPPTGSTVPSTVSVPDVSVGAGVGADPDDDRDVEVAAPGDQVAAPEPTVAPSTTEPPLPAPSRPVRILVAGDSTATAIGAGVVGWALDRPELAQVEIMAAPGCGFVRGGELQIGDGFVPYESGCETFVYSGIPERARDVAADLVVLATSSWDVVDRRWSDVDALTVAVPPSEYADRVVDDFGDLTQRLLEVGVPTIAWLEMPTSDPDWETEVSVLEDADRHAVLHRAMGKIADQRPDQVHVIDFDGWFGDAGFDEDRSVRPDGIHLTPEVATDVVETWMGERLLRVALGCPLASRRCPTPTTAGPCSPTAHAAATPALAAGAGRSHPMASLGPRVASRTRPISGWSSTRSSTPCAS